MTSVLSDIKSYLSNLPDEPGVYQMLDSQHQVIYVGKAKNLKKRVASYFRGQGATPKTSALVSQIADITITITHSETEALLLECNLIKQHRPYYNVLLRDDKSYPYISLSHHAYPRIDIYRGTRNARLDLYGPYPSSYAVRDTIQLLQKLFQLRTCRDHYFNNRSRPCILYELKRCTAPCVDYVDADAYAEQINLAKLYLSGKRKHVEHHLENAMKLASESLHYEKAALLRDQLLLLRQLHEKQYVSLKQGDADVIGMASQGNKTVIQLLSIREGQLLDSRSFYPSVPPETMPAEVLSAFLAQHYLLDQTHRESIPKHLIVNELPEEAQHLTSVLSSFSNTKMTLSIPVRGEKKKWLDMATESAKQSLAQLVQRELSLLERFEALRAQFQLPHALSHIECFDISHTMGEATVASCVVLTNHGLQKALYRKFNISNAVPGDDPGAIRLAVTRRYQSVTSKSGKMPDLILIDGGKAQLRAAESALSDLGLSSSVRVWAISKGEGRKPGLETIHQLNAAPIHLDADSPALHLLQWIRDEAHRFAIIGHRERREKRRQQSLLDNIPGVGASRKRLLLRHFGSIRDIARATVEDLCEVDGISFSLAEKIYAVLHDKTI